MNEENSESDSAVSASKTGQHSLLIRALWFVFIGWWAANFWLGIAWLFVVSIIGMPLGFWMINRVPKVLTLKKIEKTEVIHIDEDGSSKDIHGPKQRNLAVRALYFLLIGWWLSFLWMGIAGLVQLTIIGLPLAIWMYNRIPEVTTLYRQK